MRVDISCVSCRFFHNDVTTSNVQFKSAGECRRYRPQLFGADASPTTEFAMRVWPIVYHQDWCGEYEVST